MKGKKILIVSQYFYPETFRINDIAKEWLKQGNEVDVITGIPNYPMGKFFKGFSIFKRKRENYHGVNIKRLNIIPRYTSRFFLVLNYASFVISGFFWKLTHKKKYDLIFAYEVSPLTQVLPAVWYAKKTKTPLVSYITDLWPDNIISVTKTHNKTLIRFIDRVAHYIYQNSNLVLTSSNSFKETIIDRGIPVGKVKFWPHYAEDFYNLNHKQSNYSVRSALEIRESAFKVFFTGNIGFGQGLDILVPVTQRMIELNHDVQFVLIGDGRFKKHLIKLVNDYGLSDRFIFVGQIPPEKIPLWMIHADLAFLSLADDDLYKRTIPSKLQSYMLMGKPILAAVKGESADIITAAQAGFVSDPGDSQTLASNLEKAIMLSDEARNEMGINSKNYYQNHYDKKNLMKQFDEWMEQINE